MKDSILPVAIIGIIVLVAVGYFGIQSFSTQNKYQTQVGALLSIAIAGL